VLVTGAALLIGWKYTQAYYDRLGVPVEALDLEPAVYLTAKIEIWYALAGAALGGLSWMLGLRLSSPYLGRWAGTLLIAAGALTFVTGSVGTGETGNADFVYACGFGFILIVLGVSLVLQRGVDGQAVAEAATATAMLLAFTILFVAVVPAELGRHDAEAVLAGAREASGARVVATEPLGLPGELPKSGFYVTDGVRVVAATNNAYCLVAGGAATVYCLPANSILRMEYTPDDGR